MAKGENAGKPGSPGWQRTDQSKSVGKIPPVVDVSMRDTVHNGDDSLGYESVWESYQENIDFSDTPEESGPPCGACGEPVDLAGPWSKHFRLGCYIHTTCDTTNVMGEDVSMHAMQVFYPDGWTEGVDHG